MRAHPPRAPGEPQILRNDSPESNMTRIQHDWAARVSGEDEVWQLKLLGYHKVSLSAQICLQHASHFLSSFNSGSRSVCCQMYRVQKVVCVQGHL